MTVSEAASLVVDLTREVSQARAERDAWRLVARSAIHHIRDLGIELERIRDRYHRLLDARKLRRNAA